MSSSRTASHSVPTTAMQKLVDGVGAMVSERLRAHGSQESPNGAADQAVIGVVDAMLTWPDADQRLVARLQSARSTLACLLESNGHAPSQANTPARVPDLVYRLAHLTNDRFRFHTNGSIGHFIGTYSDDDLAVQVSVNSDLPEPAPVQLATELRRVARLFATLASDVESKGGVA